jgi:pilus assembly protein CpaF
VPLFNNLERKLQQQEVTRRSPMVEEPAENEYLEQMGRHYKERLLREADVQAITKLSSREMRRVVERLLAQFMSEERLVLPRRDRDYLISRILDESVGLGPLEALLADDSITEIMINSPDHVFVERRGRLEQVPVRFKDEEQLRQIIDRIVAPIGRRIDESSPMVDARLPDGSRVNAVIKPISLHGTSVSIRRFSKRPYTMDDLAQFGSFSKSVSRFLQGVVESRMNVLISGGTGSGKTTLLNAVANAIPAAERVVTIEDMSELRLARSHIVGMECRPPNVEGKGVINIRDLVRNALRMRPDRIIVGEVRGGEAFDMLQAMNTGHEGSLTTLHANSVADAIRRLESMVIMAETGLPSNVIRDYIHSAIDIVIQVSRLVDGSRKLLSVCELQKREDGSLEGMAEIFRFEQQGMDKHKKLQGYFTATGIRPRCLKRFHLYGVSVDENDFVPTPAPPVSEEVGN